MCAMNLTQVLSNAVAMMDINLKPISEVVEILTNVDLAKTTVIIIVSISVVVMNVPVDMVSFLVPINVHALTSTSAKIATVVANKSVTILKDLTTVHVAVDSFPKKVTEKNAKKLKIIITIRIWRHQEEFMTMMIYGSLLLDYFCMGRATRVRSTGL